MSRLGPDFARIYDRELERLADEVSRYASDEELWSTQGSQKNPPGTLTLHIVGVLQSAIGQNLGNTGYVRDRDREFSERGRTRADLAGAVNECRETVIPVLEGLDDALMAEPYPGRTPPYLTGITTQGFLMHLLWHLGWHLGHIYYHRLGLDVASNGAALSAPSVEELGAALAAAGTAHADYEKRVLGGEHDEAWPGWYAAYVLGRVGDFTSPTELAAWLEAAPQGSPWSESAASFVSERLRTDPEHGR